MVFYLSLSDSKSPQVSRILLSILADLNAGLWMVFTCPLIYKSSSPFINHFDDCTKRTIYIWYHRHFHVQ